MAKIDNPAQALQLAQAILSDIARSNAAAVEASRAAGSPTETLTKALFEGRRIYESRVAPEHAALFSEAVRDVLRLASVEQVLERRIEVAMAEERWPDAAALLVERAEATSKPEDRAEWLLHASGILEYQLGDLSTAIEALEIVRSIGYSLDVVLDRLAKAYQQTGDYPALVKVLRQRIEHVPTGPQTVQMAAELAQIYRERLEDPESAKVMDDLVGALSIEYGAPQPRPGSALAETPSAPIAAPSAPADPMPASARASTSEPASSAGPAADAEDPDPEVVWAALQGELSEDSAAVEAVGAQILRHGAPLVAKAVAHLSDFRVGQAVRQAILSQAPQIIPLLMPHLADPLKAFDVESLMIDMGPESLQLLARALSMELDPKILDKALGILDRGQVTGIGDLVAPFTQHADFSVKMKAEQLVRKHS